MVRAQVHGTSQKSYYHAWTITQPTYLNGNTLAIWSSWLLLLDIKPLIQSLSFPQTSQASRHWNFMRHLLWPLVWSQMVNVVFTVDFSGIRSKPHKSQIPGPDPQVDCVHFFIYIYILIYVYVCVYTCIYVYIHTYICKPVVIPNFLKYCFSWHSYKAENFVQRAKKALKSTWCTTLKESNCTVPARLEQWH